MTQLWTLFVVVSGLAQPIEIDGYQSEGACLAEGAGWVADMARPITTEGTIPDLGMVPIFQATFRCTQLPEPPLSCD